MALAINKILVAGAVTNVPAAYLQTVTISTTSGANLVSGALGTTLPAGVYEVGLNANVTIAVNNATNSGTINNWISCGPAQGTIVSDGVNVQAFGTSGVVQTLFLFTVDGGVNINSTFANV